MRRNQLASYQPQTSLSATSLPMMFGMAFGGVIVWGLVGVLISMLPEIRRYLKIKRM